MTYKDVKLAFAETNLYESDIARALSRLKRKAESITKANCKEALNCSFGAQEHPMSDVSAIEWTDASWNPVTGCTKVSPGCAHCYAERFAERLRGTKAFPQGFDLVLHPERLTLPIKWKRPRRIFVNSMSDLFHEAVPFDFVDAVFDTMQRADQHIYQILTKRPERLLIWSRERRVKFPEHIWVGASVENQRWARRIDDLAQVDAAVRFLSCEPILKQLDLTAYLHSGG